MVQKSGENQLVGSFSHYLQVFFCISGGAGFLPSVIKQTSEEKKWSFVSKTGPNKSWCKKSEGAQYCRWIYSEFFELMIYLHDHSTSVVKCWWQLLGKQQFYPGFPGSREGQRVNSHSKSYIHDEAKLCTLCVSQYSWLENGPRLKV